MRTAVALVAALAVGCGHLEGVASPGADVDGGAEDGATAPDGGAGPAPPSTIDAGCVGCKLVFVSSIAVVGDGVVDSLCSSLANMSSDPRVRGRSFHAWRSITGRPASVVVSHEGAPYVRTDGTPVAANWAQLVSGSLLAPIDHDENGKQRTDMTQTVWTGTSPSGDLVVDGMPMNCSEWGDASMQGLGIVGRWAIEDSEWTNMSLQGCNLPAHVYCFED